MRIFPVLFVAVLLYCSCSNDRIKLWQEFEHVYTSKGEIFDYSLPENQSFIVTDFSVRLLEFYRQGQIVGKIDSIITANPDWGFIFYCKGEVQDSVKIIEWLKDINASFPVILDPKNEFSRINRIGEGSYGIICDKSNKVIIPDAGMIGDVRTPFDRQFLKAKASLKID